MWLRQHRLVLFLIQQAATFVSGLLYLGAVRVLTGKRLHGGQDSLGWVDGTAYVVIVIALVWLTVRLYHWVRGAEAPPLGVAPSRGCWLDLIAGIVAGGAVNSWLWIVSLLTGSARVVDVITNHHALPAVIGFVALGAGVALVNGLLEETTSRAFPARLFHDWSVLSRTVLLAVFFALQHLIDEPFILGRFLYLCAFGALLTIAYLWRGNIWLPLGLHAGYLLASIVPGGRWHLGSLYQLSGQYAAPLWLFDYGMLFAALVLTILVDRAHRRGQLQLAA